MTFDEWFRALPENEKVDRVAVRKGWYAAIARAALPAPSVPAGWKLVPIEPTPAMVDAAREGMARSFSKTYDANSIDTYKAMLAAAPSSLGSASPDSSVHPTALHGKAVQRPGGETER